MFIGCQIWQGCPVCVQGAGSPGTQALAGWGQTAGEPGLSSPWGKASAKVQSPGQQTLPCSHGHSCSGRKHQMTVCFVLYRSTELPCPSPARRPCHVTVIFPVTHKSTAHGRFELGGGLAG